MQTNTKAAARKFYGAKQEWGAKARKNEAKFFRGSNRDAAIKEAKDDG